MKPIKNSLLLIKNPRNYEKYLIKPIKLQNHTVTRSTELSSRLVSLPEARNQQIKTPSSKRKLFVVELQ